MDPRLDTGGWLALKKDASQHLLPTGTLTLQDTPRLSRRDNVGAQPHIPVRGMFNYLYLNVDIYSRKIVAWSVHDEECSQLAAARSAPSLSRIIRQKIPLIRLRSLSNRRGPALTSLELTEQVIITCQILA